jgi:hypothetical protein
MGQLKTITHALFGVLTEVNPERLAGRFEGRIEVEGHFIELSVDGDDLPLEKSLRLAEYVTSQIMSWLPKILEDVADSHLSIYNENWADEKLSRNEFLGKIRLKSIDFLGDSIVSFLFDDSDLFWGHTIVAEYFNIEANVTLPAETKGQISLFG